MNLKELVQDIIDKKGVKAVFGDPIVKDQATIIPVAKLSIHGCGCDRDAKEPAGKRRKNPVKNGEKTCQGLAVKTMPLGYIEIRRGNVRFIEIMDKTKVIQAGIMLSGLALFLLARLVGERYR